MLITFVSDTHLHKPPVKPCDILIHCGDALNSGHYRELSRFLDWFTSQPASYKIYVAGNHDICVERPSGGKERLFPHTIELLRETGICYLEDKATEVEGLKIYGSPYSLRFYNWAFQLDPGRDAKQKWAQIPEDTDILVTHGPPYSIMDKTVDGRNVGCNELLQRVRTVQPKIHAFGHVHESYGMLATEATLFINAALCDENYRLTNKPITIDVEVEKL